MINRFEDGKDGWTALEPRKGKRAKHYGIEFGEGALWRKKPAAGALGKLSSALSFGVFVGVKGRSGAFIVLDINGVWKTRTVQRRPIVERWPADSAEEI